MAMQVYMHHVAACCWGCYYCGMMTAVLWRQGGKARPATPGLLFYTRLLTTAAHPRRKAFVVATSQGTILCAHLYC
jgi:hypothetical protein